MAVFKTRLKERVFFWGFRMKKALDHALRMDYRDVTSSYNRDPHGLTLLLRLLTYRNQSLKVAYVRWQEWGGVPYYGHDRLVLARARSRHVARY